MELVRTIPRLGVLSELLVFHGPSAMNMADLMKLAIGIAWITRSVGGLSHKEPRKYQHKHDRSRG
jgi:hypothetical protein